MTDDRIYCKDCEHFDTNALGEHYCHKRIAWFQIEVLHRCSKLSGHEVRAEIARNKIREWLSKDKKKP